MATQRPTSGANWQTGGWIALVALAVSGCGGGQARISGRVTLDGIPVPGAQVVFVPDDEEGQGPVIAVTNDGGNYKLVGNSGGGVPPGKYKVVVTKFTAAAGKGPGGEGSADAREDGSLKNSLPTIYEDRSATPLEFDVPSGSRTIDLELNRNP